MRFNGHNILAIFVAALAIYLLEYVIFAVLMTPEQYMGLTGVTEQQLQGGMERMPLGVIPPILTAIGLSFAVKWRGKPGWLSGAVTGLMFAVLFALGTSLYSYVYGPHTERYLLVNLGHFLACWGVAGAILGAWK